MSNEHNERIARRDVLKVTAASGALAVGGFGIVGATPHEGEGGPGNSEGGNDHGNGNSEGRGGNKGGNGGGGGDKVTGGSALVLGDHQYSPGDDITVTSRTTETITYWAGCSAAEGASEEEGGGPPANQTYQRYDASPTDIYVKASRSLPIPDEGDAIYNVVEVTEACGEYNDQDVDKLGLGPEEGAHEEP